MDKQVTRIVLSTQLFLVALSEVILSVVLPHTTNFTWNCYGLAALLATASIVMGGKGLEASSAGSRFFNAQAILVICSFLLIVLARFIAFK